MSSHRIARSSASRRRTVPTPPPPPPPGGTVVPYLPFSIPDRTTLRASGRRVYPHYFTPHQTSITGSDNHIVGRQVYDGVLHGTSTVPSSTVSSATAFFTSADVGKRIDGSGISSASTITAVNSPTSVTISSTSPYSTTGVTLTIGGNSGYPDYYDKNFLAENQPLVSTNVESQYNVYGGLYRNRPLRHGALGTNWSNLQIQAQIQQAYDAGCDGFIVECLSPSTTGDPGARQLAVPDCVDALGLSGKFDIIPMIDFTGSFSTKTSQQISDYLENFRVKPAQTFINGKMQVALYAPEKVTAATLQGVLDIRAAAGHPVEFTACYVADLTTVYDTYDPVVVRHGRWGDRDPASSGANNVQNRLMAANIASRFAGKPCLGYVAPGDERPHLKKYYENRLTEQFRTSWDSMINGEKPTSSTLTPPQGSQLVWQEAKKSPPSTGYQPDWIQIPTWNDYSEGAMIEANRNYGFVFLDLGWYYNIKYKLGYFPPVTKDCIYLSHRVEFTTGMTYTDAAQTSLQVRSGNTAGADLIEAAVFATDACTITITCGSPSVDHTFSVPSTGFYIFTTPLVAGPAGSISAVMTRSGAQVSGTLITSPWAVSHTNYVMDKSMRGGSSLRGWSASGDAAVPSTPIRGLPVT